jgi:hypothetical protein
MCRHPCHKLNQAYKGYQGQNPDSAKFIFIGIDANFSSGIENLPIFKEILDYLTDGVGYWKNKKRHHPFLSQDYKKGIGYKYHQCFSIMGLTCKHADKISFVELLPFPTCGTTSRQFMRLFNADHLRSVDHLRKIDSWIHSSENIKDIFISRGVHTKMHELAQSYGCFKWLLKLENCASGKPNFERNNLYTFQIPNSNNKRSRLHVITHFSDAISDKHLKEIGMIIQS